MSALARTGEQFFNGRLTFAGIPFRVRLAALVELDALIGSRPQLANPVANESRAGCVDEFRADVRHSPPSLLRHPIVQDRSVRIAGREDLAIGNAERSLHRLHVEGLHFIDGDVAAKLNVDGAAGSELMAVGAIHLQIGTGPSVQVGAVE